MSLISELNKLDIVKKGKFKLKSGELSDYYIDIKKAFGSPKAFRLIVNGLCKIIDPVKSRKATLLPRDHGASKRATCIAGSGYGGLPLVSAVAFKLNLPLVMVRDKAKKHGAKSMIDGYIPTNKDKIAIIDDVFTTGTCISDIVASLKSTKAKIIAGYVVVKRGEDSKLVIPIKSLIRLEDLTP